MLCCLTAVFSIIRRKSFKRKQWHILAEKKGNTFEIHVNIVNPSPVIFSTYNLRKKNNDIFSRRPNVSFLDANLVFLVALKFYI